MRKNFLLQFMFLLCALIVGSSHVWATVPANPVWVATALADISDNATVVIICNSTEATNIALPSTATSTNPAKKTCTVTTTDGITTITPPAGTTIQDLAWTLKKNTGENTTYQFYQEGSSIIRLYLTGTSSNTALRVGDATSSNDQFVLGGSNKLLKVTTGDRYVGPYDNNGSDWRTYSSETATNYKGAVLTFYVLKVTTATTPPITSTGNTHPDLKNGTSAGSLSAAVTVTSGGAAVDGATVTWTSSNTDVATIASNGTVTLVGTGSTTITANYAGNSTYSASSANYILTVTDTRVATTTTISDAGLTNVDLKDGTAAGSLSASVKVSSTDAAVGGATVTWASSDEDVATIASDGTVTLVAVGTTTITASYAGGGEYGSSSDTYDLTVIDTRQETTITIDNWNTLFGTSFTGSLSGTDLTDYSGTTNNVVVDYKKGTGSNMYINSSELRAYEGNSLEFTAPSGYVLTSIVFTKGSKWGMNSADPGTLSSQTWTATSSTNFVTFDFSGRTDITKVVVTLAETVPVTITTAKYATYSSAKALDFSATGITVYKAKVEGSVVKMSEVTDGIVPANTGVVLYKDVAENTTIAVPVTTTEASISDNELVGVTADTGVDYSVDSKFNYILQMDGSNLVFNKATGATLRAGRSYLSTTYDVTTAAAPSLQVVFDGGVTTAISEEVTVNSDKQATAPVYNLAGQRVSQPTKGLYIVGGKKVVKR